MSLRATLMTLTYRVPHMKIVPEMWLIQFVTENYSDKSLSFNL